MMSQNHVEVLRHFWTVRGNQKAGTRIGEKRSVFLCGLVLRMLIFDRQNGIEPSACAPFVSRKLPLGLASVSDCAGWFMEYELAGLKPYDDERLVDAVALHARIAGAVPVGYRIEIPMRVAVPFKIDVLARC